MAVYSKNIRRIARGIIAALPALPYVMMTSRRRRPSAAYVLGGIGLLVMGGLAAAILLSPRARRRALTVAQRTYGRVNGRLGHARIGARDDDGPLSNGVSDLGDYPAASRL